MAIGDVRLSGIRSHELNDVEAIFDELRAYSTRVDGQPRRPRAALEFTTALPPGCDSRDKHAFVAFRHGVPFGLLDMIDGHPARGTAFIGLLAVKESAQGMGAGRRLYEEAERFARDRLGARRIRLAVVDANPVTGFWRKMGFEPTGEVKPYEGVGVCSQSVIMQKELPQSSE